MLPKKAIFDTPIKLLIMKKFKILFWISTGLIFLFQGVMPALTGHTEMAKEGIQHLGYPEYFGSMLTICKVLGAVVLIVPQIPKQLKEWAYAGFTFDFVFAAVSLYVVDGLNAAVFFPIIVLGVLMVSYFTFHKLSGITKTTSYETQTV